MWFMNNVVRVSKVSKDMGSNVFGYAFDLADANHLKKTLNLEQLSLIDVNKGYKLVDFCKAK